MCGRYVITNPIAKTKKLIKSSINVEEIVNYNAHPYQKLPVIKKYINGNTLENLKWGIIPSWSKKKEFKPLINARLETINDKISFKNSIKLRRCVVIADGFYEWHRKENNKIPHFIYRKDKKNLFIAAIYENNEFCLITESASSDISSIHNRQPVLLYESDINKYLNLQIEASIFLSDRKIPVLNLYKISKEVNKPSNNNRSLIQKI